MKRQIKKPDDMLQSGFRAKKMVPRAETAGYQTFPERKFFPARRNLTGIFRSPTSPNTISIFKWYSVVLLRRYDIIEIHTMIICADQTRSLIFLQFF